MRSLAKSGLALLALTVLTSCDGFGPFNIVIKPAKDVVIVGKNGSQFSLRAGENISGVRIEGKSKKIVLSKGDQKLTFEGAAYAGDNSSVICDSASSKVKTADGEAIGLNVARNLLDSQEEVFTENRHCEIREQRCWQVCNGPNHSNCHTECTIYTRPGIETVERRETRLTFSYAGQLASSDKLADFDGRDVEVYVRERMIFPCH